MRLYGIPVGILEKTPERKMYFAYLKDAKMAISQSMPLKERAFDHKNCKAYFGGLIPENETFRAILAERYQFDSRDIFSFLVHCGQECVGAISFHDISAPIVLDNEVRLKTVSKQEQACLLPGEEDQKAICLVKDKIFFPAGGAFSTHIMTRYENEEKLENAYFCLKMAQHAGLIVPEFCIKLYTKRRVLITKRTDRVIEYHGVKRLHQEDFCQALGRRFEPKYERDKGPGWAALFDLLKVTRVPAYARNYLIKIVIFNVMINHTLAHAKQFSLVASVPNVWELAPFNNFYCHDDDDVSLAMAIGEAKYRCDIQEKDWKIFCEKIQYTFPIFKAIKKEYEERLHKAVLQAQEDFKKEGLNTHLAKKWVKFILS